MEADVQSRHSVSAGKQTSGFSVSTARMGLQLCWQSLSVSMTRPTVSVPRMAGSCGGGAYRLWQSNGHQLSLAFEGRMSTLLMIMRAVGMLCGASSRIYSCFAQRWKVQCVYTSNLPILMHHFFSPSHSFSFYSTTFIQTLCMDYNSKFRGRNWMSSLFKLYISYQKSYFLCKKWKRWTTNWFSLLTVKTTHWRSFSVLKPKELVLFR